MENDRSMVRAQWNDSKDRQTGGTWLTVKRNPGFWDVSVLKVMAVSLPTLSWKCERPRGKMVTSPGYSVAAYRTLSSLTKPVYTLPFSTNSVSAARGCVCSGTTPPMAKSRRPCVMPCVLMPGYSSGVASVAMAPVGLEEGSPTERTIQDQTTVQSH